jgi:transcription elongation factor
VKIINGIYKGKKGVIKNIFKNYAFLYNQDFVSTNGIFVDKTENLEILGSELLNDYYTSGGKVNYRKAPESLTRNLGNLVRVIAGNWKGYIGILKKANDKMVSVELTSKNKIITLDLNSIQLIDNEGQKREDIYNNSFSTPRSNFANKTPAYYPQSPNAHSLMSPGWNPSTRKFKLIIFSKLSI